jgi:hypothetical protein
MNRKSNRTARRTWRQVLRATAAIAPQSPALNRGLIAKDTAPQKLFRWVGNGPELPQIEIRALGCRPILKHVDGTLMDIVLIAEEAA